MRLAWSEQDVRDGFEATKREGLASFGDDRVFIEKFIEAPRHIEIQVLGDKHGNIVYLNERECSIQRRHQKVVEEAPSPFVTPKMRRAMGEQCVALAQAVGYHSAGTVELIVSGADPTGESFYFLEMNTRLQVEHPVTEEITGLDLVEQMIRVAAGERLAFGQNDVRLDGWSVETRVYAEDPYRGFLPSTGRLVRYAPPLPLAGGAGGGFSTINGTSPPLTPPASGRGTEVRARIDDGVFEGGEVSMFYDPMIAKLITWGPTREAAIDAQIEALDGFEIGGISHNVDFLSALMQHSRFRSGNITTGFIAEEYPEGFTGAPLDDALTADLSALAAFIGTVHETRALQVDQQLGAPAAAAREHIVRLDGGAEHHVQFTLDKVVVDGGTPLAFEADYAPGQRLVRARIGQRGRTVLVERQGRSWRMTTRGGSHRATVMTPAVASLARHMIEKVPPDLSRFLLAPMPGLLTRLDVAVGDRVEAGQPIAVMEAMKMENILRAEKSATVKATPVDAGSSVAVDQVIVEFE
jgi:propionyl-CoA carboxylase alpha chain